MNTTREERFFALLAHSKPRAGMHESQRDSVPKAQGWRRAYPGNAAPGGLNPDGVEARSCCPVQSQNES